MSYYEQNIVNELLVRNVSLLENAGSFALYDIPMG
jgi:hypothetical protein